MTTTRTYKRRADHTVADILRIKPKWFLDKQDDQNQATSNLAYIHTLMEYGQNHIADAPFIEVFGGYKIDHDPNDLSNINKAIMTFKPVHGRSLALAIPSFTQVTKLSLLSPEMLRAGLKPMTLNLQEKIRQLNRTIEDYKREIDNQRRYMQDAQRQLSDYHRGVRNNEKEIELLEYQLDQGIEKKIDPEKLRFLKAVPKEWIVVNVHENSFTIVRKTPIVMKYIGTAESGMAKTLHMGFMCMTLSWDMYCQEAFWLADFISTDSAMHPHLSGASICWGNQSHKAEKYHAEKDYKSWFELFESVMTTYCPDQPYQDFVHYERRRTSNYTALATISHSWWPQVRDSLIRTWALTASDSFIEALKTMEYIPPGQGPMTPVQFADKCQQAYRKLIENREAFNDAIHAVGGENGVNGEELKTILRDLGIWLAGKNDLWKLRVDYSGVSNHYIRLFLLCHGMVPARHYGGTGTPIDLMMNYSSNMTDVYVQKATELKANGYIRVAVWKPDDTEGMPYDITTSNNFRIRAMSMEDVVKMSTVEEEKKSTTRTYGEVLGLCSPGEMTVAVAANPEDEIVEEIPYVHIEEDEEEACDHDWSNEDGVCADCGMECSHEDGFRDDGNCRICGEYNSNYDEYYEDD